MRDHGQGGTTTGGPVVALVDADETRGKRLIADLLRPYLRELAAYGDAPPGPHGDVPYRWLDDYWRDDDRRAFLITRDRRVVGFVMVRGDNPRHVAEFYVVPERRRSGVGRTAAQQLFARFPGLWSVRQLPGNDAARRFWRAVIPFPFRETRGGRGTEQRFVGEGAAVPLSPVPAPYDATIYAGAAEHYRAGRPPYSRQLRSAFVDAVGLDGHGRLLDVGCGPGVLTLELADLVDEAIGLDPDPGMLAEAARRAEADGIDNVRWVEALAEELPTLGLGAFRVVTFGQSFHWTDRERVAEIVYDLLEPGGAMVLVVHTTEGRPVPPGPGAPPIPHDAIRVVVARYLGPHRRAGLGFVTWNPDRFEDALARTRFGPPETVVVPGRADIVFDVDGVLAGYLSTSFAAPHLFGERRAAFEADVRRELRARSPDGRFWDWPGDTAILVSRKPA